MAARSSLHTPMQIHRSPTPSLLAFTCAAALATAAGAQAYSTTVVARGLLRPTGIVAAPDGTLWITEVPDPGQGGARNAVSRLDANGTKTVLVPGEPQPTHLARDAAGTLYWTCLSAGVVQRFAGGTRTTLLRNLASPSGMAIGQDGTLYLTQVPTPGVNGMNGGRNSVDSWTAAAGLRQMSMGEPEPRDVAVDPAGNLFWTCKSAGVILRRDAATGRIAPLLRGLEHPSGIAVDAHGDVYFSEVPTPGTSAANGGRNRVSHFSPATSSLQVVDFGDPEPTDVAVSPDGRAVYWTCSSAGVVVRAERRRAPITVTTMSPLGMGHPTPLLLRAPEHGGHVYVAASSFGLGPIPLGSETLALTDDVLLLTTIGGSWPQAFAGYVGRLDGAGAASAAIVLPTASELRGATITTAFVVLDAGAPLGLVASETLRLTVD